MHELSIAQEILRIVNEYLPEPTPNSVKSVKVRVGRLSNILTDSLTFCYEALTDQTPLEGSKLEIIELPVKISCANCGSESEIEPPVFACPACGNNQIKIVTGTELRVDEIELFDEIPSASSLKSREKEEK
ncbi:MAG: hydrogenase maturation nickel metallochaperone HypA [Ignavibacteriaceae bacterium]